MTFPRLSRGFDSPYSHLMKKIYILVLIIVIGLGTAAWFYSGRAKSPVYESVILAPGELVQEVSVTGRVKPSRELALAFKRSGRLDRVAVAIGQTVWPGALLLQLDATDEARAVREANLTLASRQLTLNKLLNPVARQSTENKLQQAYEDGLTTAVSLYADMATAIDDLDDIFFGQDLSPAADTKNIDYYADLIDFYDARFKSVPGELRTAHRSLEAAAAPAFTLYQTARSGGDGTTIERAINAAADLAKAAVNVIKIGRDTIQFFKDKSVTESWQPEKPIIIDGHLVSLATYYANINADWLALLKTVNTIKTEHSAIDVSGLDVDSARLDVEQATSALAAAEARLDDSYLRAPLGAVVTDIGPEMGEMVTANTAVISLISADPLILEANVPEADVAKIKVGDPIRVTLDAYGDDIIFEARVVSLDPAAVITDGVATYRLVAHFLKVDERIKSGLTAELIIATARRDNALAVPERAVANRDGAKMVRVVRQGASVEVAVETGLRGSDGRIEITSGLAVGDEVIIFAKD